MIRFLVLQFSSIVLVTCCESMASGQATSQWFRIIAIDENTGRGVPMVRLNLDAGSMNYYTDSHGVIAFHEPGLMGKRVYFKVEGHGYTVEPNEHGEQAVWLKPTSGEDAVIRLQRRWPGQRLYRITGLDPWFHSRRLGDPLPIDRSPLQAGVMGQDSVFVTTYKQQLFWFWGDTFTPGSIPYDSNHEVTAATTPVPGDSGPDPDVGIVVDYFKDRNGYSKKMIAPEDGGTMTWLDGLVSLTDQTGQEHLFVHYMQVRRLPFDATVPKEQIDHPLGMWWPDDHRADYIALARLKEQGNTPMIQEYRKRIAGTKKRYARVSRGLMEFSDEDEYFHKVTEFPLREADELHVGGHAFRVHDDGTEYICYSGLFPNRRVSATVESIMNIDSYASFTCLKQGTRFSKTSPDLDRRQDGSLNWQWKLNTSPIGPDEQKTLVDGGHIRPEERWIVFRDVESDREVRTQHNTIKWNPYRQRYAGIFSEATGSLGNAWYAEADTAAGPWVYMQKIVSHNGFTFYNPCHFFDKHEGREVFVEGTVTQWFGTSDQPAMPRYQYNQVMYKLNLEESRLVMPVAVYHLQSDRRYVTANDLPDHYVGDLAPVFFAADRPRKNTIPVYRSIVEGQTLLTIQEANNELAFYAEPADAEDHGPWTVPLFEFQNTVDGSKWYSVTSNPGPQYEQPGQPICFVWTNPSIVETARFSR